MLKDKLKNNLLPISILLNIIIICGVIGYFIYQEAKQNWLDQGIQQGQSQISQFIVSQLQVQGFLRIKIGTDETGNDQFIILKPEQPNEPVKE